MQREIVGESQTEADVGRGVGLDLDVVVDRLRLHRQADVLLIDGAVVVGIGEDIGAGGAEGIEECLLHLAHLGSRGQRIGQAVGHGGDELREPAIAQRLSRRGHRRREHLRV